MAEKRKKVLAVDVDGTLCQYDGWKGPAHFGPPNSGMVDLLKALRSKGWVIVVWTTRKGDGTLRAHLTKHDVPFDYINKNPHGPPGTSPKIFADVYLDDRALPFDGKTDGLLERIEAFVPWFEKQEVQEDESV